MGEFSNGDNCGRWIKVTTWEYVPSPDYSGDINIYFTVNSHKYYPGIMINNLPNGIHGIEQKVGNSWVIA